MKLRIDVTKQVDFADVDGEDLPLTKCVCGAKFPTWEEVLGVYDDRPWLCPSCGVNLVFSNDIRVYKLSELPTAEKVEEHKERQADADAHSD